MLRYQMKTRTTRSEKIDVRISPEAKRRLRAAADVKHKTVSEFVLDSALNAAEEVLHEQRSFYLKAPDWEKFVKALESPPKRHVRLERLLREPSIFD